MTYRIAIDTGGTFSAVLLTSDLIQNLKIGKALTTAERVFTGIAEALGQFAGRPWSGIVQPTSIEVYALEFEKQQKNSQNIQNVDLNGWMLPSQWQRSRSKG